MPWINQDQPNPAERIVAGACYLTFGLVGLLYMIISGRSGQTSFFRFHFLQSIILGIIGLLLNWTSGIFLSLVGAMLGMVGHIGPVIFYWLSMSIIWIVRIAYFLLVYGMIWAFLGKYAEIPFISDIVRRQMH